MNGIASILYRNPKKIMQKTLLVCLFIVSGFFARAQKIKLSSTLSPAAMTEDFNYLRKMLETTAPGLYAHQTPERVKIIFDSIATTLQQPLPFPGFYSKIAFVIAELHCEHSQALPEKNMLDEMMKQPSFLPLQLDFTGTNPIIIINGTTDTSFKPGDEIVSINGRAIHSIRDELYPYLPADGFITSSKAQTLSSMSFNFFYTLFIDQPRRYEVVIKTREGKLIKRVFEKDLRFADITRNALANPVNKIVLAASERAKLRRKEDFTLEFVPEKQAAFLTVRTFGVEKAPYEKKIDNFFREIKQKGVRNLVIDLSYNDGGEEERAAYLLSYLVSKPTRMAESEFLLTDRDEDLKLADFPDKIRKNKYDYISPLKDGKSMVKLSEYAMELATIEPKTDRFEGKIFLYVNGRTASAASAFSAIVQSNKLATIVGEETSGAYKGGGVAIAIKLVLPNSKIRTQSSLAYINLATTGRDGSRGVIPDHRYVPGFDAMVAEEMEWRKLIMGLF
jgi:hypothetical protein